MTKISALTPGGFTAEITYPDDEHDPSEWLLEVDKWLTKNGFRPLPVPKSGGGSWNKDSKPTPKNWVDVDPEHPVLYVCLAWHGKDKDENDAYKIEWANKLEAATGVRYTLDTSKVDAQGKKMYLWVYPLKVGKELLAALPEQEFERREALKKRLEAKKDK